MDQWCKEIDEEEARKEQEALAHAQWLKEREARKQEIERAWRPVGKGVVKRKASDSLDNLMDLEQSDESQQFTENARPALSPLLTSLLKSPSQVTSNVLHTQRPVTNPTIASLLNTSPSVNVSAGLQHLVSTAINQEQISSPATPDLLENDALPNIKMEDLECSILSSDEPLPEIKNEEVEVIISDLIENADDIVNDPEQHLKLDDNEDIITNLENVLEELEEEEKEEEQPKTKDSSTLPKVDPFEFEDEPEYPPAKPSRLQETVAKADETKQDDESSSKEQQEVEVVEVVVMENEEEKQQKEQQQQQQVIEETSTVKEEVEIKEESENDLESEKIQEVFPETSNDVDGKSETKETSIDLDAERRNTFTPEYSEELYDLNIEVTKLDKSGKAKRDYSRTKKKEEKDFDILLGVDKTAMDDNEIVEDAPSAAKIKSENERSNSPWTEDDDMFSRRRRRYSTPATPSDSVPNSPASSSAFYEDDREYRNWKKSVMLVYSRFTTHKFASLFLKPITDEQAPGYHSVIYRPMDLQTIRKNIESGVIRTNAEFQRDVLLMFNNAIMYNKSTDHVFDMAKQMQQECIQQIQLFLQAQAQTDAPPRRETRTSEPGGGSKRKRVSEDVGKGAKKRKED